MIKSRPKFCFNSSGAGGGVIAWPGSHVITFSVGPFTCKEHVMLIEREIRLLFCVNKQVMRQSSMASHETFMRLS